LSLALALAGMMILIATGPMSRSPMNSMAWNTVPDTPRRMICPMI
jgi:hypothetical protein